MAKQPTPKPKLSGIKAKYGLKTAAELGALSFITSGVAEIDGLTGGIPRGRITEIYGATGVGKTSLSLKCLSSMSQSGTVLYIDAENAINLDHLTKDAIQKNIHISTEYVLEEAAELTLEAVNDYDIIVVDSIASLVPRPEADGEMGDQLIGIKARLMGKWMRRLVGPLGKSNCAMLFINQLRESPSIYTPKFTPGGKALPYAASLRIELSTKKADRIEKDKKIVGHKVTAEVVKSRVSPPFLKTQFKLMYDGIAP